VFLSEKDLRRIARYLRLSWGEALRLYCRVVRLGHFSRISLKEKPNLDCIFWKDGSCSLYQARPLQCRSYPFWSSNLHSPQAWESAGKSCPGIGTGTFYSRREIEAWLRRREHEALISVDDEYFTG